MTSYVSIIYVVLKEKNAANLHRSPFSYIYIYILKIFITLDSCQVFMLTTLALQ